MKSLYDILKAGNYWFTTYHIYYKNKLGIKESIFNRCFFYYSSLFGIIKIQTNNILILANNNFANKKEVAIKFAKIMTKD